MKTYFFNKEAVVEYNLKGHTVHPGILQQEYECRLQSHYSFKKFVTSKTQEELAEIDIEAYVECTNCGEKVKFSFKENANKLVAKTSCKYKDGFPEIVTYIDVPSGEIVLFNDLRQFYEELEEDFNTCTNAGIKAYSEAYAKQGLITHFVGNTCPDVSQKGNILSIGESKRGKVIGDICTDLWWYCAADRVALEKAMKKTVKEYQKDYHATGAWPKLIIAKVEPGRYKTIGRYHIDDKIYSTIEREE